MPSYSSRTKCQELFSKMFPKPISGTRFKIIRHVNKVPVIWVVPDVLEPHTTIYVAAGCAHTITENNLTVRVRPPIKPSSKAAIQALKAGAYGAIESYFHSVAATVNRLSNCNLVKPSAAPSNKTNPRLRSTVWLYSHSI